MLAFKDFINEKMTKDQLEIKREEYENEMTDLASQIKKAKSKEDKEILKDTYDSYKKKLTKIEKEFDSVSGKDS